MTILGLDPILAAIIFTAVGAGLQFALGYLASDKTFDVRKALSTVLVSAVVGITALTAAFEGIPEDASDLVTFGIIFTVVLSIAGIDAVKNNIIGAARRPKKA
ncbi:MAG: hypothetical protein OES34_06705 [Nitrosopumilus sp.]|nr:hypothetical protein [Nitrosopumilus sp.]